jgi:hypothetical protein
MMLGDLADSLSLQSFGTPIVPSDGCLLAEPAGCTTFMSNVVSTSSTAPTHDVYGFALALAH